MSENERLEKKLVGHIAGAIDARVYDDCIIIFFKDELDAYRYAWNQRPCVLALSWSINLKMWYVKIKGL